MANKYLKRCSASLIIREIQIKTSVVYHLTLIKMSLIRNTRDNKCCQKIWRKGNTCVLLVRMYIGAPAIENSMEFPQKMKNRTII